MLGHQIKLFPWRSNEKAMLFVMSTYLSGVAEDLTVDGPSATFTYRRIGPRSGIPLVLANRVRATIDWWTRNSWTTWPPTTT